jgi:hypothetical protein
MPAERVLTWVVGDGDQMLNSGTYGELNVTRFLLQDLELLGMNEV